MLVCRDLKWQLRRFEKYVIYHAYCVLSHVSFRVLNVLMCLHAEPAYGLDARWAALRPL
jgi:hypothetical protein